MGISAKARASTALRGTTSLPHDRVLAAIKDVAGGFVKTRGVPVRFRFIVVGESSDRLDLSLTTGKNEIERCTFSARVTTEGRSTEIRVGGLDTYRTASYRLFGVIPAGPKEIEGIVAYKRFLEEVQQHIQTADPTAELSVVQATD